MRSVTSVTAVAKLSVWLVSGAKALEDQGEHEAAGEGGANGDLRPVLDHRSGSATA
jgi:hypothetical protein